MLASNSTWTAVGAVLLGGLLAACGGIGEGTLDSCFGPYAGTFTGDRQGQLTMILRSNTGAEERDEDPILFATFYDEDDDGNVEITPENQTFNNPITVTSTGAITGRTGSGNRYSITGQINLEDCTATGDWIILGNQTGTWLVEPL